MEGKKYENFEEFEEAFDNIPEEMIKRETYDLLKLYNQTQQQLQSYKQKEEEYKQIISGLEIIKEHNMPNDTKFVIMAKEDYLRNLELLNEGSDK